MKVLITGASGKLAPFIISELADKQELILTSRRRPIRELSCFPWIHADLNCFNQCLQVVKGVEVIQHLGAQPEPVDHPDEREWAEEQGIPFDATFKTNLLGTYYLLHAAVKAGVQVFVVAGSNCALGHGFRISNTPFPIQTLPIDENHPCYPEDSYSFSKRSAEDLLATYTRAYKIRTYVTRLAEIKTEEQRRQMAEKATQAQTWNPWLWCWVAGEEVANAHRLIMEAASDLPPHDVYFVNADDTTALESSPELVKRFKPELRALAKKLTDRQSFISCNKIKSLVGWKHKTSWRCFL